MGKSLLIFDGKVGTDKDCEDTVCLVDGAKPILVPAPFLRNVTHAILYLLEKEYDRLETDVKIKLVNFSELGTPVVPFVKADCSIREY